MALAVVAACGGQGQQSPRAGVPATAKDAAGFAFGAAHGALLVSRPAQPLGYADGLPAKRAAMAYCAGQGAALNPAAFGHFAGSAWAFEGGCV